MQFSKLSELFPSEVDNQLLCLLPEGASKLLNPHLKAVALPRGHCIAEPDRKITHVYFLSSGIASIFGKSGSAYLAETSLTGREGCVPFEFALGSSYTVREIRITVPGWGYRVRAETLQKLLENDAELRRLLLSFVHVMLIQTSDTALSLARNTVSRRLARWLLMCHDRTDGECIQITHELLSTVLAVRRPSVTSALHELEGKHYIRSRRGVVVIRDRSALEDFAADTYGRPEAEYCRQITSFRQRSVEP